VPRIARLLAGGVTTIEIKSGYGLTVADELRTLRVMQRLAQALPARVVATCLGAHEVPLEYRDAPGGREAWLAALEDDLHPAVAREGLRPVRRHLLRAGSVHARRIAPRAAGRARGRSRAQAARR
jgi:imidazolonepropionase